MTEGDFITSATLVQALEQLQQAAEACPQLLALAAQHLELPSHGLELLRLFSGLALPPLRGGEALLEKLEAVFHFRPHSPRMSNPAARSSRMTSSNDACTSSPVSVRSRFS